MPRPRAARHVIKLLPVLSKVCSSSSSSLGPFLFTLRRSSGTATERWDSPAENNSGYNSTYTPYSSSSTFSPASVNYGNQSGYGNWIPPSNSSFGHSNNQGYIAEQQSNFGLYRDSSQGYVQDASNSHHKQEEAVIDPFQMLDENCANGKIAEAVNILIDLEQKQIPVDFPRVLKLIEACGDNKKLEEGRAVHNYIIRSQFPLKVRDHNKLLTMYGKCGATDEAFTLFNSMRQRNMTSWETMITYLSRNNHAEDAINLFSAFKQAKLIPDEALFNRVLFTCGILHDVNEGFLHFESMQRDFNIDPSTGTYESIVGMLGNCGHLQEAFEFIETMPVRPTVQIWETLMRFCAIHGDTQLGNRCADIIKTVDPGFSEVLSEESMGSIEYKFQKKREEESGSSGRGRVREYRAGDTSDPDSDKLYRLLRCLKAHMKEAGYVPETRCVLHDVDVESKEEAVHAHSERLATANALMSSPPRAPIRIMKNLRVCVDCHNAIKIISSIVGRLFIMRDAKRFHHVKDGVCSCKDYW